MAHRALEMSTTPARARLPPGGRARTFLLRTSSTRRGDGARGEVRTLVRLQEPRALGAAVPWETGPVREAPQPKVRQPVLLPGFAAPGLTPA